MAESIAAITLDLLSFGATQKTLAYQRPHPRWERGHSCPPINARAKRALLNSSALRTQKTRADRNVRAPGGRR